MNHSQKAIEKYQYQFLIKAQNKIRDYFLNVLGSAKIGLCPLSRCEHTFIL